MPHGMRAGLLFLLIGLLAGCVTNARSMNADIVPSSARLKLRDRLPGMIEKLLQRDDWMGKIVARTTGSTQTVNDSISASEDVSFLDVVITSGDHAAQLMSMDDASTILGTLRKRIRDLIEDEGGEQLDWKITENYHSRTLWFQYKQEGRFGWLAIVVAPKLDGSDDLTTRFTITIHEQPLP